jgi:alpha-tubulin suppressor-like RCC1 family protein
MLRRGSLLLIILLLVDIFIASPSRSGPPKFIPHFWPIIPGSLSLFFGGPGNGAVTMALQPVGVPATCFVDCTKSMGAFGRTVSLSAAPEQDSVFAGWGGACSGTSPTCTVTLGKSTGVIAYFRSAFRTIAAGQSHTCSLRPDGVVFCWGRNNEKQLGTGSAPPITAPVVAAVSNVVAIATGGVHTCALIVGGQVACWGDTSWGQVGILPVGLTSSLPTFVPAISDAVAITAGGFHSCAVHAGGAKASCWGSNSHGQLGDGLRNNSPNPGPIAVNLAMTGPITKQISAGGYHTCAIVAADASVACWGANDVGELGQGTHFTTGPLPSARVMTGGDPGCAGGIGCANTPALPPATFFAIQIAASIGGYHGGFHTIAIDLSGLPFGWGNNNDGEINRTDGGEQDFATPALIALTTPVPVPIIAAGAYHTCVASKIVGAFCTGQNSNWQSGPTPGALLPMTGAGAVGIAAGGTHSCTVALGFPDPLGLVLCWGDNSEGQVLGVATPGVNIPSPVPVALP